MEDICSWQDIRSWQETQLRLDTNYLKLKNLPVIVLGLPGVQYLTGLFGILALCPV